MKPLIYSELKKRPWRIDVFIKKMWERDPFELQTGRKFIARLLDVDGQTFDSSDRSASKAAHDALSRSSLGAKIAITGKFVGQSTEHVVPLGHFAKNHEFGGKGTGGSLVAENIELQRVRKVLEDRVEKDGPMTLTVGRRTIQDVVDVKSTAREGGYHGSNKADFDLIDKNSRPIGWLSHKAGNAPDRFQQWGGMTEPQIANHPEVRSFVEAIRKKYPRGVPPKTVVGRRIRNRQLRMMGVYGVDSGGGKPRGPNNVDTVLQGVVQLVGSSRGRATVSATAHRLDNGTEPTGGYEPILVAIYKGDRSQFGLTGTRFSIFPLAGRPNIVWI